MDVANYETTKNKEEEEVFPDVWIMKNRLLTDWIEHESENENGWSDVDLQ